MRHNWPKLAPNRSVDMAYTQNKTQPHSGDVGAYINSLDHPKRRRDGLTLLTLMQRITGEKAVMWGPSIIGFGRYHYKYEGGREGEFFLTGFAPRKANMVVYIMPGYQDYSDLLSRLGPHKIGKSCLYITDLEKIELSVLEELITKSVAYMRDKYPTT